MYKNYSHELVILMQFRLHPNSPCISNLFMRGNELVVGCLCKLAREKMYTPSDVVREKFNEKVIQQL